LSTEYTLKIAGGDSLHKGIHRATVMHDCVSWVLSKNSEVVKQTNLSADRTSLTRTLEMTLEKIELICSRLGIKESDLQYDRTPLSKPAKLGYRLLFLKKMLFEAFIPT